MRMWYLDEVQNAVVEHKVRIDPGDSNGEKCKTIRTSPVVKSNGDFRVVLLELLSQFSFLSVVKALDLNTDSVPAEWSVAGA